MGLCMFRMARAGQRVKMESDPEFISFPQEGFVQTLLPALWVFAGLLRELPSFNVSFRLLNANYARSDVVISMLKSEAVMAGVFGSPCLFVGVCPGIRSVSYGAPSGRIMRARIRTARFCLWDFSSVS